MLAGGLSADALRVQDPAWIRDVIAGMHARPRRLPTRLLYDARGSELFEQITTLPEYYLTRTEMAIFDRHLDEMAEALGPDVWLIELGSGSGVKTRRLLRAMAQPAGFMPIEISRTALSESVAALSGEMPVLRIIPVCSDFSRVQTLPSTNNHRCVVFFPGSTIGNFGEQAARSLMRRIAGWVGPGGGLLLGVDLVKSPQVLVPAYDDAAGVTAEFNLNLLDRLNREADADFDRRNWSHRAVWNGEYNRMESYLVSECQQRVHIAGRAFDLHRDEAVLTEQSQKYTLASVADLAEPFSIQNVWTDDRASYAVMYLRVNDNASEENR